jgi:selenide,water dikinase
MSSLAKRVVLIGGGHANCQVLKMLKRTLPKEAKITLINEAPKSYYSGMLPGAVSRTFLLKYI